MKKTAWLSPGNHTGLYLNIVTSPITNISHPELRTPNVGGINAIRYWRNIFFTNIGATLEMLADFIINCPYIGAISLSLAYFISDCFILTQHK